MDIAYELFSELGLDIRDKRPPLVMRNPSGSHALGVARYRLNMKDRNRPYIRVDRRGNHNIIGTL